MKRLHLKVYQGLKHARYLVHNHSRLGQYTDAQRLLKYVNMATELHSGQLIITNHATSVIHHMTGQ